MRSSGTAGKRDQYRRDSWTDPLSHIHLRLGDFEHPLFHEIMVARRSHGRHSGCDFLGSLRCHIHRHRRSHFRFPPLKIWISENRSDSWIPAKTLIWKRWLRKRQKRWRLGRFLRRRIRWWRSEWEVVEKVHIQCMPVPLSRGEEIENISGGLVPDSDTKPLPST